MRSTLLLFLACMFLPFSLTAAEGAIKHDLEQVLLGKTFVSKIMFGGRAMPRGYQADYGVNRSVEPISGDISYRVEWGTRKNGLHK
jgi:hypothetical protein